MDANKPGASGGKGGATFKNADEVDDQTDESGDEETLLAQRTFVDRHRKRKIEAYKVQRQKERVKKQEEETGLVTNIPFSQLNKRTDLVKVNANVTYHVVSRCLKELLGTEQYKRQEKLYSIKVYLSNSSDFRFLDIQNSCLRKMVLAAAYLKDTRVDELRDGLKTFKQWQENKLETVAELCVVVTNYDIGSHLNSEKKLRLGFSSVDKICGTIFMQSNNPKYKSALLLVFSTKESCTAFKDSGSVWGSKSGAFRLVDRNKGKYQKSQLPLLAFDQHVRSFGASESGKVQVADMDDV